MRILIAGASGAIGRPLVRRLRADQHEVFALTRSPNSTPLKKIGAEPVIADALDAAAVKAAVERICWRRGTKENDPVLVRHSRDKSSRAAALLWLICWKKRRQRYGGREPIVKLQ